MAHVDREKKHVVKAVIAFAFVSAALCIPATQFSAQAISLIERTPERRFCAVFYLAAYSPRPYSIPVKS